jgi:regulatory protein YycI of two-component signal transduction system YycFG
MLLVFFILGLGLSNVAKADIYFRNLSTTPLREYGLVVWNHEIKLNTANITKGMKNPTSSEPNSGYVFVTNVTASLNLSSLDYNDHKTTLGEAVNMGYNTFANFINVKDGEGWYIASFANSYVYDGKTSVLITVIDSKDAKKFGVSCIPGEICAIAKSLI